MDNVIPVVYAANDAYFPGLYTSILSVIEGRKESAAIYRFYIFYTQISQENLKRLRAVQSATIQILPVYIELSAFGEYEPDLYEQGYYSVEMYYRLLIPRLLPQYDKVIYLDADVLVFDDLSQLLRTPMGDSAVAAVCDLSNVPRKQVIQEMLRLNPELYFNSGVLLIQTQRFRQLNVFERCMDIIRERKELVCPDQDALNIVCRNDVCYLDDAWNFQYGHTINHEEELMNREVKARYDAQKANFKLIHFTAPQKPWNSLPSKYHYYYWMIAAKSTETEHIVLDMDKQCFQQDCRSAIYQQFQSGEIGFVYIWKFIKAWFRYKLTQSR